MPETTDAAFLYYRDDKIDAAPATWQEVYQEAKAKGGIVYQGAAYEGLTCDFLELVFAAGGKVLSDDGLKAAIDSPQNVKALQLMVDGVKSGAAPKAVTTYMEPESLTAFQTGKYAFMRNWPYAYALNQKDKDSSQGQLRGRAAAELRGRRQGRHPRRPQLGDLGLLEEPGRRADVRRLRHGPENDVQEASEFSLAPVLTATYDDATVKKALPFSDELKQAVAQAKARPSRRSIRRSRRRSTTTSTTRWPGASRRGRDEEGAVRDGEGAGDLLGVPGHLSELS